MQVRALTADMVHTETMASHPASIPTHDLNNGTTIPAIGLGTYGLRGDAGIQSLVSALGLGYRLLDTALNYENEAEVGEAVRAAVDSSSGDATALSRDDILVTTKLPGRHHGFDETLASFEESL